MAPETVLIVLRFLSDGAALVLWGTCAFMAVIMPAGLSSYAEQRLRMPAGVAVAAALVAILCMLPVQAANAGDGWADAFSAATLWPLLQATNVGTSWGIEAAAVIFLVVAFWRGGGWGYSVTALAAACLLAGLAATGHAAAENGWLRDIHRLNDVVHVLAAGIWFGGLFPVLLAIRGLGKPSLSAEAQLALSRFSVVGHVAVILVFLTGAANTWLILGGLPEHWARPYPILLGVKIGLVVGMSSLAILNRYIFVPMIARDRKRALVALQLGGLGEIILGTLAISAVAWFGTLDPRG